MLVFHIISSPSSQNLVHQKLYDKSLKELGLFWLAKRRLQVYLNAPFQYLKGVHRRDERLFTVTGRGGVKKSGFRLGIRL